jgi:hypothetical protein
MTYTFTEFMWIVEVPMVAVYAGFYALDHMILFQESGIGFSYLDALFGFLVVDVVLYFVFKPLMHGAKDNEKGD